MATFKETCALTSRKYLFELSKNILDLSEKLQLFWSNSPVYALEKQR